VITRDVSGATGEEYDLIVIGGGIYGASLALEATRRGLRPLLLERADFGGATTWSSLRIVHGGLRYLQSLDLRRFRTSVAERRWFCRTYPDLVETLECVMPLFGSGLKRPSVFRAALFVNDLLSKGRNAGVREDRVLPPGRLLDPTDVRSRIPLVRTRGLRGGALWYDVIMKSSVRVLVESLRWACRSGATALNYVEALSLGQHAGRVVGVHAVDRVSGQQHFYRSARIVNCAGPWCREVAGALDRDVPELFNPSLAFNLLFDRPALGPHALAVEPPARGATTYFVVPWNGRMLAGTHHLRWTERPEAITPPEAEIDAFIDALNRALPGLGVSRGEVRRSYAGQLPAAALNSRDAARTPILYDHRARGGPQGLVSVSGVKWTTARDVAERTLALMYGSVPTLPTDDVGPRLFEPERLSDMQWSEHRHEDLLPLFRRVAEEESVVWLDDLLLRRVEGLDTDAAVLAAVRAGLHVMRAHGGHEEEHLRRLLCELDTRLDKAAATLRSAFKLEGAGERGNRDPAATPAPGKALDRDHQDTPE
jgi:glycerol-3-phosphate dehydrogenase